MNPFYTLDLYGDILEQWIWHFNVSELSYWPSPAPQSLSFLNAIIKMAATLELLTFHVCLDSELL